MLKYFLINSIQMNLNEMEQIRKMTVGNVKRY